MIAIADPVIRLARGYSFENRPRVMNGLEILIELEDTMRQSEEMRGRG